MKWQRRTEVKKKIEKAVRVASCIAPLAIIAAAPDKVTMLLAGLWQVVEVARLVSEKRRGR